MSSSSIQNYVDYRVWLKSELEERCHRNQSYSLRAFAGSLGMSASFLSRVLTGKRGITIEKAEKIARNLHLGPHESHYLKGLVLKAAMNKVPSGVIENWESKVHSVELSESNVDSFHFIADWYHQALFELFRVRGFRLKPRWIAGQLGITQLQAKEALERLERMGLIQADSSGKLAPSKELLSSKIWAQVPPVAYRKCLTSIGDKLGDCLRAPSLDYSAGYTIVATDEARIKEIKKRIIKFKKSVWRYLEKSEKRDVLYAFTLACFPLTKGRSKSP